MPIRTRTPSLFRPRKPIDQSVLAENRRAGRGYRPPRHPARRAVAWRADHADRLRRQRGRQRAESRCARCRRGTIGSRKRSSGRTIWRRPIRRRRWSSRRVSTPITPIEDVKPIDGATWQLELAGLHRRQAAVDGAADLSVSRAGNHHQPHLRRGLGLHRPMVRPESARLSRSRRRRSDGQIRLFHLRRRLYRKHRHGDARCIRRRYSPPNMPATRSPIRSAIRCGCAPRPSSATRTRNGSKRSKSANDFRETFWSKQGFNWFAGI